jgi:demethylmenaquinone methyltransferase / 2-methoxy-6-polyprenyl-1,4-benzoquinol methylase
MDRYPDTKDVTPEQHTRLVKEIFSTVPGRYDFLTRLLSLRLDIVWRRFAVKKLKPRKTSRLLDVATGTADLAIEMALQNPSSFVAAMDLMAEMMVLGAAKLRKGRLLPRVGLVLGDALKMPFSSEAFDAASIAFGIRNIPDKMSALREMSRVVAPGGQVLVLEMTRPGRGFFGRLYVFYLRKIMPLAGRIFSPNPAAYQYLADSIRHFPSALEFSHMMRKAGLCPVRTYALTFGITHLFVGYKEDARPTIHCSGSLAESEPQRGVI